MQEVTWNDAAITEKKEKQYLRQIIYTNKGHLSTQFTPDINFNDEPVVQYDIPVVENTFIDDWK